MDSERLLFEKGCFLPSWAEDIEEPQQAPVLNAYVAERKDLPTLLAELDDIKQHIQDVRQRQWDLARLLNFHNNEFARE